MTKLEAINEMLESLGEPAASALDTGGTSIEAEAETIYDREKRRVLGRGPGFQVNEYTIIPGWACNGEEDIDLNFASVSLTGTITTGTFTKGERVTQATSGAVGLIIDAYTSADTTYLIAPISGTFNGANNITGGTSGTSTATVTAVSNPTSGVIPIEDDVIHVKPYNTWQSMKIVERARRLYDQEDNTFTFDDAVKVALTRNLNTADLPEQLASYIVKVASFEFQRFKKRGQVDDAMASQEMMLARVEAERESRSMRAVNPLHTSHTRNVKGRRRRYFNTEL